VLLHFEIQSPSGRIVFGRKVWRMRLHEERRAPSADSLDVTAFA